MTEGTDAFLPRPRLTGRDLAAVVLVIVGALVLNGYGLGSLEYFRHTEADRTLIAWEMLESGDYLLPHLLHSEILTKPPLYYWTLAASMKLFGTHAEWAARVPSVLASALLGTLQLLVFRRLGFSLALSLLSAAVTLTGFSCFVMATLAEIDFLYALFTAASLYAGFFAIMNPGPLPTLCAYALAGVAFLIKGPPVVFFFIASVGGYLALEVSALLFGWPGPLVESARSRNIPKTVAYHLCGALVFVAVVSLWLVPLAARVSWEALGHAFRQEVVDRVVATSRLHRGPHFYVVILLAGLLPWSAAMAFGLYERWQDRGAGNSTRGSLPDRRFLAFNLVVVLTALLMLSVASGKSSRYIFPVFPFASNLVLFGLTGLEGGAPTRLLSAIVRWLGVLLGVAVLGGAIAVFAGVLPAAYSSFAPALVAVATALGLAAAAGLYCAGHRRNVRELAIATVCLMFVVRFGQVSFFNPVRNAQRSMKPIARQIDRLLPPGAEIYHVELFDRWASYYLKGMGRETYRLTPKELDAPRAVGGRSFILLSGDEEGWRIEQLRPVDASLRILLDHDHGKDRLVLIEVDPAALPYLKPSAWFPTSPTPPFYQNAQAGAARTED